MIYFLLDTTLYTSVWIIKQTFNGAYYLVYGSQETTEDKINKLLEITTNQQKEIENLKEIIKNTKDN